MPDDATVVLDRQEREAAGLDAEVFGWTEWQPEPDRAGNQQDEEPAWPGFGQAGAGVQ